MQSKVEMYLVPCMRFGPLAYFGAMLFYKCNFACEVRALRHLELR